jgi:chromosome segregation ATPase
VARAARDNHAVAGSGTRGLLDVVRALEERDSELAERIASVDALLGRARWIHERSLELDAFLAGVPGELASLEHEEAEAGELRGLANRAVADAEAEAERVARARRVNEEQRAQADRELVRAREAAADADARIERIEGQRAHLAGEEQAGRAEGVALADDARAAAAAVRAMPRVSESGRAAPGTALADLAEWSDRVHAALLVVQGGLVAERERIVREAGEIGAAALGEPLAGASVVAVRQRLEQEP